MKTAGKVVKNLLILLLILALLACLVSFILVHSGTGRYPVVYGNKISQYAEKYGLDPSLVAGVVKTESDFRESVVAKDGGMGLMQLMPETAEWCSKKMSISYSADQLLDVDYNLDMGCFYLSYLIQRYQSIPLAIAAYNGGHAQVDKWLQEGLIGRDGSNFDKIPVQVTRNYVDRVNKAEQVYRIFYTRRGALPDNTAEGGLKLSWNNWISAIQWARSLSF